MGVERLETTVQLGNHRIECGFRDRRVAPVAVELVFVFFDVFENVGFQVGACRHIHDLENRDQRKVMIERLGTWNQFPQPAEQLLKPQVGSEALVKGVFVKDHAGGFLVPQGVFGCRWRTA